MPQPDTSTSPPGKPIIRSYPTPDLRDRIYVESRDARLPDYQVPEKGSKYEGREAPKYEGWIFATAAPSDKVGWTDHYYLNERENQDEYNFTVDYPWVDRDYPRITRTYVFLRSDARSREPEPHVTDTVYCDCVMVDWRVTRLEDPVQDSLFIGITKTFERVPAPIKVVLDRPESVLPFNQRVAVPGIVETTVEENATDGESPEITNQDDWHVEETSNTAFRKTVERTKRVLPPGGSVLQGETLTRQQQVGVVTSNWQRGRQTLRPPRARVIEASVTDVGNDTSIKEETLVDRVFPATEFRAQIPDTVPPEFRDLIPTRTTGISEEGQAAPPNLAPGETERVSEQVTDLVRRETVTGRDLDLLPKTLVDQLIDGIQTHGVEMGGVFDNERTLARGDQEVEEGFGIIRSNVKHLGSGLTARETERLSTLEGAHLLLTDPGSCYFCDPAVVFTSGTFGSGAAATADVSAIPPGGTGDGDPGGTFPLTFASNGDANGIFYFLGARYHGGIWQNPSLDDTVIIRAISNRPVSQDSLDLLVDREPSNTPIYMQPGGSHEYIIDLGIGRALTLNKITLRTPNVLQSEARTVRVDASNNLNDWTDISGEMVLPAAPIDTWVAATVANTTAWRYFRIYRIDTNSTDAVISLGEVEFYGSLTITPGVALGYVFDGDDRGVFFYLGRRGGSGTWRNPQTNGDIVCAADGLALGTLDGLVDRQPSNIYTDNLTARAFYFDLKAGRSLVCNKVSFRQRTGFGSSTVSFDLQGRNDLGDPGSWISLVNVHVPQTPDTWVTVDVPGTNGYRQFRIISAQPYFTIGELELYGALSLGTTGGAIGAVTGVIITSGGANYVSAPEVRFSGGGGTGAAGTAIVVAGAVIGVSVTNGGVNYTSPPTVSFFVPGGGKNAVATSTVSGGAVTGFTVTNGGSEYGAAPMVTIVGTGTGATAHAEVSTAGAVTAVILDTAGTGYTVAPSVLFSNAGGPTAIARVGYGVAHIQVLDGGSNYNSPPAVRIAGDGINCTASAIIGFSIGQMVINHRGSGYTSNPGVNFSGGSGATGLAVRGFPIASVSYSPNATLFASPPEVVVSNSGPFGEGAQFAAIIGRPLFAISVGSQGSGYTLNPTVTIGGDGSGAAAHSVRSFALASITTDMGGSGYTTPPTVIIAPPTGINGVQATAHAVLTGAAVTSVVIDNPGFGYLTAPTITFSSSSGTGAAATAVLATAGAVDSIVVDTAGTNYTAPPPITLGAGGGGSGASASSSIDASVSGQLRRIDIISVGSGYITAPTLSVAGGTTPIATLSTSGGIVAVTITSIGSGFTTPAAVTFIGGGGSGADGTAYPGVSGSVTAVQITNHGEGFTAAPDISFSSGNATAVATLEPTGKIKTLILIDPGPEYTVPPLISFFGCWAG